MFVAAFAVMKSFIIVSEGTMGPVEATDNGFQTVRDLAWELWVHPDCWWACGLRPQSTAQRNPVSCLLKFLCAGQLQWQFTCGVHFKHSLWFPFVAALAVLKSFIAVPVDAMGPFQPRGNSFQALGDVVDSAQIWQLGPRLPLTFRGLSCSSCWSISVTVYFWSRFQI